MYVQNFVCPRKTQLNDERERERERERLRDFHYHLNHLFLLLLTACKCLQYDIHYFQNGIHKLLQEFVIGKEQQAKLS